MKKIINGKLYDTETARSMGSDSYRGSTRDFSWWREELYLKRTGEFFLYGEGGPMSRYSRSAGQNSWTGGEAIQPLSPAMAREWAEEHLDADEYAEIFGMPSEDADDVHIHMIIPARLDARLRAQAADHGRSLTDEIISLVTQALGPEA